MLEDEKILALYWARDAAAIEETGIKYGERLQHLAGRLLHIHEDVEECVNDTYLGAWNAIPPTWPVYFFAFLAKLCRNLACNRLDWMGAAKRHADVVPLTEELAACIPGTSAAQEQEARELGALLSAFLRDLPQENRLFFLRRYWFMDSVKEIAVRYGVSESRVKTSLFRTRGKLRVYLEKEGVSI